MRARKSELPFAERLARVWAGLGEIAQGDDDADAAVARFFGVTPEDLHAWRAAEGRQSCPVVTSRGHACRNRASEVIDYDPRVWLARKPVFCLVHTPTRTGVRDDGPSEDDGCLSAR